MTAGLKTVPFDIRPAGSRPWHWRFYGTATVQHTPDGFELKPIGKVNKGRVGVRRWAKSKLNTPT